MNIVAACNNHYAKYLGVMLTSLLENTTMAHLTKIYIIDGNISYKNKKLLKQIVKRFKARIQYLKLTNVKAAKYFKRTTKYISKETFYRIVVPHLLDHSIDRAIYLDCDILIKEDISSLWNMKLNGNYLAAVESAISEKRRKSISLPEGARYFNSGVMVMDLQKWRKHNITDKVLQYIKEHATRKSMLDQHALNAILYDKWKELGVEWNYTTGYMKKKHFQIDKPAIIHFTGSKKPWNSDHPYKKEYLTYLTNERFISAKGLASKQFNQSGTYKMGLIVRYLAIEEYYGKNNVGYKLYNKIKGHHLKAFQRLIKSFKKNGFIPDRPIVVNQDYQIINGSHRLACSLYFNIDRVPIRIIQSNKKKTYRNQSLSNDDVKLIMNKYHQLMNEEV